jgi:hypothetical protein
MSDPQGVEEPDWGRCMRRNLPSMGNCNDTMTNCADGDSYWQVDIR